MWDLLALLRHIGHGGASLAVQAAMFVEELCDSFAPQVDRDDETGTETMTDTEDDEWEYYIVHDSIGVF